jgi:hypothetical protein
MLGFNKSTPKRMLVLGCSHLSGAYDINDNNAGEQSYAWHLWNLRGQRDIMYTVPNPGEGLQMYATIINHMEVTGQIENFDRYLIQLTAEPRLSYFDNEHDQDFYFKNLDMFLQEKAPFNDGRTLCYLYSKDGTGYANTNQVITNVHRKFYEKHEHRFRTTEGKNAWMDVSDTITAPLNQPGLLLQNLTHVYYRFIVDTLTRYNREVCLFTWWGNQGFTNLHTRKEDPWMFKKFQGSLSGSMTAAGTWFPREELSNGAHLNSEQSLTVAEHLNTELNSKGFFK